MGPSKRSSTNFAAAFGEALRLFRSQKPQDEDNSVSKISSNVQNSRLPLAEAVTSDWQERSSNMLIPLVMPMNAMPPGEMRVLITNKIVFSSSTYCSVAAAPVHFSKAMLYIKNKVDDGA